MGLLVGQGSHPGHLQKKHGFSREGMPNKLQMPSKGDRLLMTVLDAARIVREHEELSLDTSANLAYQGALHPQDHPQIVYKHDISLRIHPALCSALYS